MRSPASKEAAAPKGFLSRIVGPFRWLDDVWFGKRSAVTLGVFRMLMGFWAFVNLAMMAIDFDAWFTERGYVPIRIIAPYLDKWPRLNVLSGVTDSGITLAVYVGIMVAALLTTFGLWTRISSIALAIGYVTLQHRNPFIIHGGDLILRVSLMYIALGPCGLSCSADRLIALWKGKASSEPAQASIWVQKLMRFQIALVYLTTVWHKTKGHYWLAGIATFYPLHLNEFDRYWFPEFLAQNRLFLAVTTYGTFATEIAMGTLVFYRPFRKWVLLGGVGLHVFIEYAMNIPLFSFCMVSTYVNFYDGEEITGWAERMGERLKRFRVKVYLPKDALLRQGPGAALKAMDPFGLVEYLPGSHHDWRAENSAGRPMRTKAAICLRSPAALAFALIPGLWPAVMSAAFEPAGVGGRK